MIVTSREKKNNDDEQSSFFNNKLHRFMHISFRLNNILVELYRKFRRAC